MKPAFALLLFFFTHLSFGASIECRKLMEGETALTPPGTATTAEYLKAQQMFQSMSQDMMDQHGIENGIFAFHPGPELQGQAPSFYVVTGGDYISTILKNDDMFFRGYQNGSLPYSF